MNDLISCATSNRDLFHPQTLGDPAAPPMPEAPALHLRRRGSGARGPLRLAVLMAVMAAGILASPRAGAEDEKTGACERARAGAERAVLGADFVPFVGSSSTEEGRRATRFASFGLVGGLGGGIDGVALSSVVDVESEFVCGAQLSGAVNVVQGPVTGLQLAGAFNYSGGTVEGAQVAGGMNMASEVTGAQLGVVNYAREAHGAQIGVINVARDSDAPIGLVSIVTNGRTHADTWHDMGLTMAGVVHGGKYVHNIYGGGVRLYGEQPRGVVALGLGVRVFDRQRVAIDVDAIANVLPKGYDDQLALISQLRAVATFRLAPPLAVFAGLSANVETTDDPNENPDLPLSKSFGKSDETRAILWPGVTVGLRLF